MEDLYRFRHRLRVRYSEIDGQKIVFNAHYLTYVDIAIAAYFEEGLGLDLHGMAEEGKFDFVVAKTTLEYKDSARLGDWLNIWVRLKKLGRTSFTMEFKITREGENNPIVLAEIIYVSYNPETKTSQPVPTFLREKMEAFESGVIAD
ncbi:thioesterase family protein [Caldifermentibacillus hisashii]|uniref:acyl-CoA thioesterase n=1 Tax=Caldifermentibacillus hisashii TaxID=996558 RepID=UPI0030EA99E3